MPLKQLHRLFGDSLPLSEHRVLIALSGGPDSVYLTRTLRKHLPDFTSITLCHFNHELRGQESEQELAFCTGLARHLNVPLIVGRRSDPRFGEKDGGCSEAALRVIRYRFFQWAVEESAATVLALGHHRDEQVETVLLNIRRGAGLLGWSGIPVSRGVSPVIVRPLLNMTKVEILEELQELKQCFCEDSTNATDTWRRNFLRNRVLPTADRHSIALRKMPLQVADLAKRMLAWSTPVVNAAYAGIKIDVPSFGPRAIGLCRQALRSYPGSLQGLILRRAVESVVGEGPRTDSLLPQPSPLEQKHVCLVIQLLQKGRAGDQLHLPLGVRCHLSYQSIVLCQEIEPKDALTASLKVEGVSVPLVPQAEKGSPSKFVDADRVCGELRIRHPQPGDRFVPLGMSGQVKISDLLTNLKVPRVDRCRSWIIEDDAGIVCLWPYRLAERVRLTGASSRCLKISIQA
ncbi:MAG: tRNA lysidine(34) synthetase TilS [Planctomycetota bacterium]|jgi:tRNA(Ile)-lysidine synthase